MTAFIKCSFIQVLSAAERGDLEALKECGRPAIINSRSLVMGPHIAHDRRNCVPSARNARIPPSPLFSPTPVRNNQIGFDHKILQISTFNNLCFDGGNEESGVYFE